MAIVIPNYSRNHFLLVTISCRRAQLYFITDICKSQGSILWTQRVTNQRPRHSICPDIFLIGIHHHVPETISGTSGPRVTRPAATRRIVRCRIFVFIISFRSALYTNRSISIPAIFFHLVKVFPLTSNNQVGAIRMMHNTICAFSITNRFFVQ